MYIKVGYLLTGFRAVADWYIPVMPARDVGLGGELVIKEGTNIMVGRHAEVKGGGLTLPVVRAYPHTYIVMGCTGLVDEFTRQLQQQYARAAYCALNNGAYLRVPLGGHARDSR